MNEADEIKVKQLIGYLKLYLEHENLEVGYPIGQLHQLLHDVFYMVHDEVLGAVGIKRKEHDADDGITYDTEEEDADAR